MATAGTYVESSNSYDPLIVTNPFLSGLGATSTEATNTVCYVNDASACSTAYSYGMISAYTFSGDLAAETTWDGDLKINGWFGLAGSSSGTYGTSLM